MTMKFLDELDALVRSHAASPQQKESEDRIVSAVTAVLVQVAREIVSELRGDAPQGGRSAAMIRYRPDWDRSGARGAAMIRYRPDWDRSGERSAAMIRYRPDWDRSGGRGAAMIRYRPDWDRDPRSAAMIRYRPDWDRQAGVAPAQAAAGMLEPVLKSLAERLGPAEAAKLVQSSLSNVGLAPAAGDAAKSDDA